jgi:hypothetical protein
VLPDGTVGFSTLAPVLSLIGARELLFGRVSNGRVSSLFSGFLTEAFHRAITATGKPITQFVNELCERPTPKARQLFMEADIPRLYCPRQEPTLAKPVDLDYRGLCHVTVNMLSEKGRAWAIDLPPLIPAATTPACRTPRANMRRFEHVVRDAFRKHAGAGFLERSGVIIGVSHMPPKHYNLRTLNADGEIKETPVQGKETWEFFIGFPYTEAGAHKSHHIACEALIAEGLIRPECQEQLRTLPAAEFFTTCH